MVREHRHWHTDGSVKWDPSRISFIVHFIIFSAIFQIIAPLSRMKIGHECRMQKHIFKYLKIFSETYKLLHPALVCLAQGNWPAAYNDAELAGHRIRAVLIKSHRNDRSSMSVPRGRLARSIFLSLTVLQAHNKKRQSLCKMRSEFGAL
jgi:hypothetical protein